MNATESSNSPAEETINELRSVASGCQECPLYLHATQTVFGEGPPNARIVFIGEQPGDQEDRNGKPFIGPAGKLLDRALEQAEIDRTQCYVTNAVKHFKWAASGEKRLHKKPGVLEMRACAQWWQAELEVIQPSVLVCLGVTAATAILDRPVRLADERSRIFATEWCPNTIVTIHPSALLRQIDPHDRELEYQQFIADLRLVHDVVK